MFYCKPCADAFNWPALFLASRGRCEMCNNQSDCYDVHSGALPPGPDSRGWERRNALQPPPISHEEWRELTKPKTVSLVGVRTITKEPSISPPIIITDPTPRMIEDLLAIAESAIDEGPERIKEAGRTLREAINRAGYRKIQLHQGDHVATKRSDGGRLLGIVFADPKETFLWVMWDHGMAENIGDGLVSALTFQKATVSWTERP